MNKTAEELVKELPTIKCRTCGGAGFTAEHSTHGHTDDRECTQCPVQVQCDDCHAEGIYTTLDEVHKLLTSQRQTLREEIGKLHPKKLFVVDKREVKSVCKMYISKEDVLKIIDKI